MPEQLLTARGVGKTYGVRPVLQDFSLDLGPARSTPCSVRTVPGSRRSSRSSRAMWSLMTELRSRRWDRAAVPAARSRSPGLGVAFVHQDLACSAVKPYSRTSCSQDSTRAIGCESTGVDGERVRESLASFGVDIDLDRPVSEASDMERAMIAIVVRSPACGDGMPAS